MRTFITPFSQYEARNGQQVEIMRVIRRPDATHDRECLPMYEVRFADGETIEAWPEELRPPTAGRWLALMDRIENDV